MDSLIKTSPDQLATRRGRSPELAVIVPTFNERANVAAVVERIAVALEGIDWELVFVDDNSPDGTADAAWDLARQHDNVRCIKRLGRRGLSSACAEGILSTNAPFVAVMDGDLQHDESILPAMLAKVRAGADIAVGSRYSGEGSSGEGLSPIRQWGSNLATRLSTLVAGQELADPMSGFFMVRRDLFVDVAPQLSDEGFKILLDLVVTAARKGTPPAIAQVPYVFRQRQAGESKMSPLVVLQFLGLFLSKLTGGLLPTSFLLFALVGFSGVAVHLSVLWLFTSVVPETFIVAQILATITAMTWNFFLNNSLTYADRKLHGLKLWTGLLGFYVVCSMGGVANISIASMIYEARPAPLIAGLAGALMSSVFNYAVTRIFTWK
ncbi:glycosyltransferase family 2 protein [Devosia beringensis]|uniref:glycosyltransferase family 2 protein n=1 Tax=Devosia beringensis TaxID=2657486 RepID=UPI00186BA2B6|nr:glycosyltransferase family 2 protein [Devosia beringensis]